MIITIDGPAASGKSTVAQKLAQELQIYYINSGLLYRAVAYVVLHYYRIKLEDLDTIPTTIVDDIFLSQLLQYCYENHQAQILFNKRDCTQFLKSEIIDQASSRISTNKYLREKLVLFQRLIAQEHSCVAEGRDCGTIVFPHAMVKFFLTADNAIRAQRWQHDQLKQGNLLSLDDALKIISERDNRDAQRTISPLIIPSDAMVIDNSYLDVLQTVEVMKKYIKKKEIIADLP